MHWRRYELRHGLLVTCARGVDLNLKTSARRFQMLPWLVNPGKSLKTDYNFFLLQLLTHFSTSAHFLYERRSLVITSITFTIESVAKLPMRVFLFSIPGERAPNMCRLELNNSYPNGSRKIIRWGQVGPKFLRNRTERSFSETAFRCKINFGFTETRSGYISLSTLQREDWVTFGHVCSFFQRRVAHARLWRNVAHVFEISASRRGNQIDQIACCFPLIVWQLTSDSSYNLTCFSVWCQWVLIQDVIFQFFDITSCTSRIQLTRRYQHEPKSAYARRYRPDPLDSDFLVNLCLSSCRQPVWRFPYRGSSTCSLSPKNFIL